MGFLYFYHCVSGVNVFWNIRPLSDIRFATIFFYSVGCHFTFLMVYSEAQKVFYFDETQFIFTLVFGAFGVIPKKPVPNPRLRRFTPVFF